MILPVFKPLGMSTHQLAAMVGEFYGEKATHTGTLDPLAEGVVVVLTGDDRYKRQELASTDKEYQFEVLAGIQTDTDDLLGLIEKSGEAPTSEVFRDMMDKALLKFIGNIDQPAHPFSAKRINGRSSFDLAKEGKAIEAPSQMVEVKELIVVDQRTLSLAQLKESIPPKINQVSGDFRQSQILESWQTTFEILQSSNIQSFPLVTLKAVTSKRTYIRSLVRSLSKELNLPLVAYSILRTRNGHFTHKQSKTVGEFKK